MSPTTETEIKELRDLITDFREEVRIGFVTTKAEIQRVEFKTDIKLVELKAEIIAEIKCVETKADIKFAELGGKIDVIDDQTKLGFWGFIGRALIIAIFVLLTSFAIKYFFFGTVKL